LKDKLINKSTLAHQISSLVLFRSDKRDVKLFYY